MDQFVEDYLAHCRAAGLSPTTLSRSYGYSLRGVFQPWCREQGIERPAALTSRDVDRFVNDLLERGGKRGALSKHTAWTYAKAAKLFLAWAKEEGEKVEAEVRLPRLPKRLVDTLDREEVQRLENAARNQRDALIVRVLADSGVRVGELVRLRISDVLEQDHHHQVQFLEPGKHLVCSLKQWARRRRRRRPIADHSPASQASWQAHSIGPIAVSGIERPPTWMDCFTS
jgi:integrase